MYVVCRYFDRRLFIYLRAVLSVALLAAVALSAAVLSVALLTMSEDSDTVAQTIVDKIDVKVLLSIASLTFNKGGNGCIPDRDAW